VTNATDNTINGLSIGAGGVLGTAVTGSPFAAGIVPVGIAIDPSNSMLVVANLSGDITGTYLYAGVKAAVAPGSLGAVAVYKTGAGGALTAVAGSPFPTGTGNPGLARTNVVQ
jgi:6-phosphogluconolactonase